MAPPSKDVSYLVEYCRQLREYSRELRASSKELVREGRLLRGPLMRPVGAVPQQLERHDR